MSSLLRPVRHWCWPSRLFSGTLVAVIGLSMFLGSDGLFATSQQCDMSIANAGTQDGDPQDEPPRELDEIELLVLQAYDKILEREPQQALELIQQAHEKAPHDVQVTVKYATLLEQIGMVTVLRDRQAAGEYFHRAGDLARHVLEQPQLEPAVKRRMARVLYHQATAHLTEGRRDEALAALADAFRSGFEDVATFETDPALEPLRGDQRFDEVLNPLLEEIGQRWEAEAAAAFQAFSPFELRFDLPGVSAERLSDQQFRGRLTVVFLWGTWCPPCRDQVPALQRLAGEFDEQLAVVGLVLERVETVDEARQLVQSFKQRAEVDFPNAIADSQTLDQVPELEQFPTLLFVDPDGTVRYRLDGRQSYLRLQAVARALLGG